jgi:hypothetical protein
VVAGHSVEWLSTVASYSNVSLETVWPYTSSGFHLSLKADGRIVS